MADKIKWYKRNPDDARAATLAPGQCTYSGGWFPPRQHIRHFVYVIGRDGGPTKIGLCRNLSSRISVLQTASPFSIDLFWSASVPCREIAREMEMAVLAEFPRSNGEWVAVDPLTVMQFLEN